MCRFSPAIRIFLVITKHDLPSSSIDMMTRPQLLPKQIGTLCPFLKANPFLKINRSSIQKTNGTLWSKTSDSRYTPNFTLKFQSIWRQWFYEKIFLEFTNLWFKNQGLRFCTSPWKSFKNTHTWAFGGENDFSKFQVSNFCPLQ